MPLWRDRGNRDRKGACRSVKLCFVRESTIPDGIANRPRDQVVRGRTAVSSSGDTIVPAVPLLPYLTDFALFPDGKGP